MVILFECAWCKRMLHVDTQFAGRSAKCPACQAVFKVPPAGPQAPATPSSAGTAIVLPHSYAPPRPIIPGAQLGIPLAAGPWAADICHRCGKVRHLANFCPRCGMPRSTEYLKQPAMKPISGGSTGVGQITEATEEGGPRALPGLWVGDMQKATEEKPL